MTSAWSERNIPWTAPLPGTKGGIVCFCFYLLLGQRFVSQYAKFLQDIWFYVFVATMTLMIATIAEASLSLRDERSSLFWMCVGVAGAVLVALVGYLFYRMLF
jgi:hypothetical protein